MSNVQPVKTQDSIEQLLKRLAPQLERALPKHMTVDRFARVALTEFRKTPALAKCSSESFMAALMMGAQLGLEPGNSLGHCYLIPYGNTCQFILGYRGMIELARRSAQIVSIQAHEVYENDEFIFEYGLEEKLIHRPNLGDRGEVKLFYAIAKLVGGGYQIDMMTKHDVENVRKRSKAGNSGPWITDYNEMAKKTVVRRLFKMLPISIEYQKAASMDEEADRGEQHMKDVFNDTFKLESPKEEYTNSTDSLMSKIAPKSDEELYKEAQELALKAEENRKAHAKTDEEMFREAELAALTVEGQMDGLMSKLKVD